MLASSFIFLGLCKAKEVLEVETKIFGITESRLIILPFEEQLHGVNLSLLTSFTFNPSLEEEEVSTSLEEIFHSMGLPQYVEEVEKKGFLEKLLSKQNNP